MGSAVVAVMDLNNQCCGLSLVWHRISQHTSRRYPIFATCQGPYSRPRLHNQSLRKPMVLKLRLPRRRHITSLPVTTRHNHKSQTQTRKYKSKYTNKNRTNKQQRSQHKKHPTMKMLRSGFAWPLLVLLYDWTPTYNLFLR